MFLGGCVFLFRIFVYLVVSFDVFMEIEKERCLRFCRVVTIIFILSRYGLGEFFSEFLRRRIYFCFVCVFSFFLSIMFILLLKRYNWFFCVNLDRSFFLDSILMLEL